MELTKLIPTDWKKYISPTLAATAILIVTLLLFGVQNSMIAPFVTLSYLYFINTKNHIESLIRHLIFYLIIAVASYVAVINLPLCIIVNAIVLFCLAFIFTDEYHPTNYEPMGMALIFFQTAALHTPRELGMRLSAILVSFGIVFVFMLITRFIYPKGNPIADYVKRGFDLAEQTIDACKEQDEDKIRSLHLEIRNVNQLISEEIYSYNRTTFRMKGKVNFYCRFVVFFQVFNYMTHHYLEADYLEKAENLLVNYQQLFQNSQPSSDYFLLLLRADRFGREDFKFRFAMREMLVLTPCLVLAYVIGQQYAYWMVFSLFYMLIPSTDHTMDVVKNRVTGTLVGISLSMVLFALFPNLGGRVLITIVLNLFIYTAASDIALVAYITCATLAMQTLDLNASNTLTYCIAATFVGALVALIANQFIFQIHVDKQIKRLSARLSNIRHILVDYVSNKGDASEEKNKSWEKRVLENYIIPINSLNEERQRHHFNDQLVIRSYLITKRIEELDKSRPEEKRDPDLPEREKKHMLFMAEYLMAEHQKPKLR